MDLLQREVTLRGTKVHLTGNEYRLLAALVKQAGKIVTYDHLTQEMFGAGDCRKDAHHLQVYISRLRQKIEASPEVPHYLVTVCGIGYKIVEGR